MPWIDVVVGGSIALVGLFLLYRALKEPLDLLFGAIWKGIMAIKDMLMDGKSERVEVIQYG